MHSFGNDFASAQQGNDSETQSPANHNSNHARTSISLDIEEIEARLASLTPQFPAPPLHIFADSDLDQSSIRLHGVDLIQNGDSVNTKPPILDGNLPLEVVAYWEPRFVLRENVPVSIKFWSHGSKITRTQEFTAGAFRDSGITQIGNIQRQSYSVDLPSICKALNGQAVMTIGFAVTRVDGPEVKELQSIAVDLSPALGPRTTSFQDYNEYFGELNYSLDVGFTLGYKGRTEISVRTDRQSGVRAVGIVSGFGYGSLSQDKRVCEIIAESCDGTEVPLALVSGVTTAKADYDFYLPDELRHEKIAIVESREATYLNKSNAPFRKHKYVGVLEFPAGFDSLSKLKFNSVSDVILEVYDVVLIYASPTI